MPSVHGDELNHVISEHSSGIWFQLLGTSQRVSSPKDEENLGILPSRSIPAAARPFMRSDLAAADHKPFWP